MTPSIDLKELSLAHLSKMTPSIGLTPCKLFKNVLLPMGLTDHKSQGQHYDEPKDYLDHKAEE